MQIKLNSNTIKVIAILAMTIDHVTWLVYPGFSRAIFPILLHIIGRITCPIMCFFIAEGYHYTKDIKRYTMRLFLFAFISHFAYVFASMKYIDWRSFIPFYDGNVFDQTSVIWSLAWGLVMLRVVNSQVIKKDIAKIGLVILICIISFPSDWSCIASLCILAFGTNRGNFKKQMQWMIIYGAMYSSVYFFAIDKVYGLIQMFVVLAIPILKIYNGERGKNRAWNNLMKWLFYIYYPLHLFIIGFVKMLG